MPRSSIILLFLTIMLLNCKDQKAPDIGPTTQKDSVLNQRIEVSKDQFTQHGMLLDSLKEQGFPSRIKASGVIDVPPSNKAVISAVMGGYIKNTTLLVGDLVKRGQVLVSIENPEFIKIQQEYLEVKQQLNYLRAEFERQEILRAENISSQKNYLKAESDLKTAEATYTGLKRQLELLNINVPELEAGRISSVIDIPSPLNGSITKLDVSLGTYVSPTTPIMEIVDNKHLHLELSVFEKDILKVKKGQKINYKIPEATDSTYEAEVYLIGRALEENRTIKVHAHFEESDEVNFLPGMFVDAFITTRKSSQLAVPEEAIIDVENQEYILLLDKESSSSYFFRPQKIKSGESFNQFKAIISENGAAENSVYLSKGAFEIFGE